MFLCLVETTLILEHCCFTNKETVSNRLLCYAVSDYMVMGCNQDKIRNGLQLHKGHVNTILKPVVWEKKSS